MVNVFITIDTELWPFAEDWPVTPLDRRSLDLSREVQNYFYGVTASGEFGVRYQLHTFSKMDLKATFFVEALSAGVIGGDHVRSLVRTIQDASQEVQLQVHTEWLGDVDAPGLTRQFRQNLREFPLEEQTKLVAHGLENLREAGARDLVAMRAGNFGGDLNTLRAAKANDLRIDSSHNVAYIGQACNLPSLGMLLRPALIEGVVEIPVSFFSDYPAHFRIVQLCACSFAEIREALNWAWRDKWQTFVIVMHSFELLKHHSNGSRRPLPHPLHVQRFTRLCQFLSQNRDKFQTMHFRDFIPSIASVEPMPRWLRARFRDTLHRYGEQALGRAL